MTVGRALKDHSVFSESRVIDSDVHISGVNNPDFLRAVSKRLEEPYRSRFDPDVDTFAPIYPSVGHGEVVPSEVHGEIGNVTEVSDITEGLCEEYGVDVGVVHNVYLLDANPDLERFGPEMRAHNDTFIERYLDRADNLYGTATIGVQVVDEAIEEIERMANEPKIVGLLLHSGGQDRALGDPRYDEVYAAAEDAGLPIVYHSTGSGGLIWNGGGFSRGMKKLVTHNLLGHTWAQMYTLASLITEGVPEKFPDLEFVMLGPGIGWVPYMMGRMNREWHQRRTEAPLLQKVPEKYVRDQFYFGTQPLGEFDNPDFMEYLIDIVGSESLLYGSDFPHYDIDTAAEFDRAMAQLSAEDRDRILAGNAADVFDLPV